MKTITIQVPDDCEVQIVKKEEKKEPVIRTYQDLIVNNKSISKGYWIDNDSIINDVYNYSITSLDDGNIATSEKVAKSMLAMAMISQLMPYYGGEITNEEWETDINKYVIGRSKHEIDCDVWKSTYYFLAFHTEKQRDEFLKYNKQLVKDYLMID